MSRKPKTTVGGYLVEALRRTGLGHVFGVQGDYVLTFYSQLHSSPLELVNTCDEQGAGFAADAYARVTGFGAVCVTYGVGGLKLVNSTAQSYAERSPVLVISGAPGVAERTEDALLHHKVLTFETQLNVFREITCATAVLDDARTAADETDRVIQMIEKTRRPGYIELPRDMVNEETEPGARSGPAASETGVGASETGRAALEEAVGEVAELLAAAERPMIVAGMEVHRFGLQQRLLEFVERSGMPFVTGVLGKSVLPDTHPQSMGVYAGGMSPDDVRTAVEEADLLLAVGPLITDLSTGIFTQRLDPVRAVVVSPDRVSVRSHVYEGLDMDEFLAALTAALPVRTGPPARHRTPETEPFAAQPGAKMTVDRLFECINSFLDDNTTVIAEPGDALFGALDLDVHGMTEFISPAYYASLGYAVPASIGVQLAEPGRRPLVITGDGGFQMTGMELSVSARYGLSPIVVILNNGGYGTFRAIIDGPFNDLHPWKYAEITRVLGRGKGFTVSTEDALEHALRAAKKNESLPTIIDVRLGKLDFSSRLRRLTDELGKRVG